METLVLSSDKGLGVSGIEEVGKTTRGGKTAKAIACKGKRAKARVPREE